MRSRNPTTHWNQQREARAEFDALGTGATVRMPRGSREALGDKRPQMGNLSRGNSRRDAVSPLAREHRPLLDSSRWTLCSGLPQPALCPEGYLAKWREGCEACLNLLTRPASCFRKWQ